MLTSYIFQTEFYIVKMFERVRYQFTFFCMQKFGQLLQIKSYIKVRVACYSFLINNILKICTYKPEFGQFSDFSLTLRIHNLKDYANN